MIAKTLTPFSGQNPFGIIETPRLGALGAYATLRRSGWVASHSPTVGPANLACGPGSSEPSAAAWLSGSAAVTSSIRT